MQIRTRSRSTASDAGRRVERIHIRDRAKILAPSTEKRLRGCGAPIAGQVTLVRGVSGAGFGQLARCGRGLLCPSCAPVVGAHRASEIQTAIDWAQSRDCSLSFVTLTMRHRAGLPFAALRDTVSESWRWAINGRSWKKDRAAARVVGYIRAFEATHGRHGWHVHVHVILIHEGGDTAERQGRALAESMFERWERGLNRLGHTAIRDSGGLDHRVIVTGDAPLGAYLAKIATGANAALELGSTSTKVGRGPGSRTPWEILRDALTEVEHDVKNGASQRLWREWTDGTKYWKTIHWSKDLRNIVGAQELSDDEIVEQVQEHVIVGTISRDDYRAAIAPKNASYLRELLELLDRPTTTSVDLIGIIPGVMVHPPPT
jgi:hypothetical protein